MRSRIFFKLLAAFVAVIAAATITLDFTVRHAWENSLTQEIERNLTQKTKMFAQSGVLFVLCGLTRYVASSD